MQTQEMKSNLNDLLCVFLEGKLHVSFVKQPWRFCLSLT